MAVGCKLVLLEAGQHHQVVLRYLLGRQAKLAPCAQTAYHHRCVEAFLTNQMRHTGAGGFVQSSTVQIDICALRHAVQKLLKVVRLDTHGALDAHSFFVVVAVAAHIGNHNLAGGLA